MQDALRALWIDDGGQDIAEYAFMLAVLLVITIVSIFAIATNASVLFASLAALLGSLP